MQRPIFVDIQRIVPGGRGMGLVDGKIAFAPLSVPGDQLEVLSWSDRKGYLDILKSRLVCPSPERVSPPCGYFGSCGGCDFQQMSGRRQLTAKRDILVDALRRVGKIQVEASQIQLHACETTAYRNRLQLKLLQAGREFSWGFYKIGSHEVCAVDSCLVASKALWKQQEILREQLAALPQIASRTDEVEVFSGDDQECLVTLALRDVSPGFDEMGSQLQSATEFLASHGFHVSLLDSGGQYRRLCGKGFVWKTVGAFRYRVSHGAFFQVNDPMLPVLQTTATQNLSGAKALELFCGVGFFTLPLSRSFERLEVVEGNAAAVADLEENLRSHQAESCRISDRDLSDALRTGRYRPGQFDLLLIDPPRTGLPKAVVEAIARLNCRDVVYVSCDPATLARDLKVFVACKYELVTLDLLDLFPHTHHLETIVRLRKA